MINDKERKSRSKWKRDRKKKMQIGKGKWTKEIRKDTNKKEKVAKRY